MFYNDNSEFSTVNRKKLDNLQRLVEDLVINKVRLENIKNEVSNKTHLKVLEQEIRIISQIQDTVKVMSSVKMRNVYSFIPNIVKNHDKEVNLILEGQEEEIDCSVVNYVNKAINYFIKSAIEDSSNRIKIKTISDYKNLTITIDSNGKNIDFDKICKTDDLLKIRSDFISLGGSIKLEGSIDEDKHITIVLPITSSITKALLIKLCNQTYAIPLEFIETIINKDSVKIKNTNNTQMILYMDSVLPLIKVREKLNISSETEDSKCILIVKVYNHTAALLVDSLLDQTDVVIRPKPIVMKDILEFKGTTILGDGIVTLVLDVPSLIKKR